MKLIFTGFALIIALTGCTTQHTRRELEVAPLQAQISLPKRDFAYTEQIPVTLTVINDSLLPVQILKPRDAKMGAAHRTTVEFLIWPVPQAESQVQRVGHIAHHSIIIPDTPDSARLPPGESYSVVFNVHGDGLPCFFGSDKFCPWSFSYTQPSGTTTLETFLKPGTYDLCLRYSTNTALRYDAPQEWVEGMKSLWQGSVESNKVRFHVSNDDLEAHNPPVATDAQSGIFLYLYDNAQILSAHSKDGKPLWTVDVIKECGIPFVGEPKIRNVTIQDGKANVVFGKHDFASLDLKSGEFKYLGAD